MTRPWPTCVTLVGTQEQYLSELSIAGSEKYERKTCEAYRKVFARARFPLPRVALRGVGDVCLVYEHGCRPCDELLLMRRWARGRADDHVTLHADLEMRDLLKTATSQSTPSATKSLRLRNDFEDFFDTERSQLIHNAEITLPFLASFGHDDPIEERCAPWIGQQDRPFTSHEWLEDWSRARCDEISLNMSEARLSVAIACEHVKCYDIKAGQLLRQRSSSGELPTVVLRSRYASHHSRSIAARQLLVINLCRRTTLRTCQMYSSCWTRTEKHFAEFSNVSTLLPVKRVLRPWTDARLQP